MMKDRGESRVRNKPDGIMLDSAQTFIPYGCPRREVKALLAEHGIPMELETVRCHFCPPC